MTDELRRPSSFGRSSIPSTCDPTPAEVLIGHGFRGWISGYQTGDISHWERVWSLYSKILKPAQARATISALSSWAKSVQAYSRRRIEVNDSEAICFCRDESLAISMVAASQHSTCPALRACAFALIDSAMMEEVIDNTETFAVTLRCQNKVVCPHWIVDADVICDSDPLLFH